MPTAGPNNPGTLADDSGFGSVAWTNPSNAAASDNNYAMASGLASSSSHYLKATNFGFSIPSGATINGITIEVEKKGAGGTITDVRVRLVKGGTVGSTDKSSGSAWPGSDAYSTYGSSSDLWGDTWTDSDINASNFGVVIACNGTGAASIDHIRITVDYTTATPGPRRHARVWAMWMKFRAKVFSTLPVFREAIPVPDHIPLQPAIYVFRIPRLGTLRIRVRPTGAAKQFSPQIRRPPQVFKRWTRFPRIVITTIASPPLRQANPVGTVYRYWQGYLDNLGFTCICQDTIRLLFIVPPQNVMTMSYTQTVDLKANATTTIYLEMHSPDWAEPG